MSVRLGQCQRGVHILRNDRARQQIAHNILIFFIKSDESIRGAEAAVLPFQAGLPQAVCPNGIQRQEGRAAAVRALEV